MPGEVIHTEILSQSQKRILPAMSDVLGDTDLYMGGGTALALQLGHRLSVDFDWFTFRLGDPERLLRRLRSAAIPFEVLSIDVETLYLLVGDVQVNFIGYEYPLLGPLVIWKDVGLHLANMKDIACMKLSAIASRGSKKDFVDLHFLISSFDTLDAYVQLYREKFKSRDIGHVVRSLVYLDDADAEPELKMIKPLSWDRIKSDFEAWVRELDMPA
jgi:hypothetical protein